jgi:hypothetical protein
MHVDVSNDVKALSVAELHALKITIAGQYLAGDVTREDYMRADIAIINLIIEKGGAHA